MPRVGPGAISWCTTTLTAKHNVSVSSASRTCGVVARVLFLPCTVSVQFFTPLLRRSQDWKLAILHGVVNHSRAHACFILDEVHGPASGQRPQRMALNKVAAEPQLQVQLDISFFLFRNPAATSSSEERPPARPTPEEPMQVGEEVCMLHCRLLYSLP